MRSEVINNQTSWKKIRKLAILAPAWIILAIGGYLLILDLLAQSIFRVVFALVFLAGFFLLVFRPQKWMVGDNKFLSSFELPGLLFAVVFLAYMLVGAALSGGIFYDSWFAGAYFWPFPVVFVVFAKLGERHWLSWSVLILACVSSYIILTQFTQIAS